MTQGCRPCRPPLGTVFQGEDMVWPFMLFLTGSRLHLAHSREPAVVLEPQARPWQTRLPCHMLGPDTVHCAS